MTTFSLKPSEEMYDIELEGSFIPSKFHPMWFFKNGLLGEEEATNASIIEANEEVSCFSTKFIKIRVKKDTFSITTAQILSFDLVVDMAISISELLKDSIENTFSIDLMLHFTFSSKSKFKKALTKICGGEKWANYLKKPQSLSFSIIDEIKHKETTQRITIAAEPCDRTGLKNTLHLYVLNLFETTNPSLSVLDMIKKDKNTLEESIKLINKIIDSNFKNIK